MWYWREENFRGLADIRASIAGETELDAFANYLDLREKGLRKRAFEALKEFIETARRWTTEKRNQFVDRLMTMNYEQPRVFDLILKPLYAHFVRPALNEWINHEPGNPIPYRWRGRSRPLADALADFRTAIALDPSEQISRVLFIDRVSFAVSYAVHELPSGYIGSPDEDLELVSEAEAVAEGLSDAEVRKRAIDVLGRLRTAVRSYLDSPRNGDSPSA